MTLDHKLVASLSPGQFDVGDSQGYTETLVQQTETARQLFLGNFDGAVSVAEAFADAWLGIGVASALDGELLVVDGVVWRVPDTGLPEVADPQLLVPFAIAERRAPEGAIHRDQIPAGTTFQQLGALVAAADSSCVTLRLEGVFSDVVLRSEHRQEPPYRHLDEVLREDSHQEVRWHIPKWEGVMVGYRFPDAREGVLLPGLHLHALSADQKTGGHVREMTVHTAELTWAHAQVQVTVPTKVLTTRTSPSTYDSTRR